MTRSLRTLAMSLLPLIALATLPVRAFADDNCTDQYLLCLNSAEQKPSPFKELAEIECFAEYVGCVIKKILV